MSVTLTIFCRYRDPEAHARALARAQDVQMPSKKDVVYSFWTNPKEKVFYRYLDHDDSAWAIAYIQSYIMYIQMPFKKDVVYSFWVNLASKG